MRESGVLLHLSSLPSPWGIGTMGAEAYSFIDFLRRSGQRCWQLLPLYPTGYGNSPYQCLSTFAGNPYLIDLRQLVQEGLLLADEPEAYDWGSDERRVDFGALYRNRLALLRVAHSRFRPTAEYEAFCRSHSWLRDYALYMALKDHFGAQPWTQWDAPYRNRDARTLRVFADENADTLDFYCFTQYLFFRQWKALRAYAAAQGISLIGDVPIYVPLDSADVWAEPQWFQLTRDGTPAAVAGCPPDSFNANGQLWGNPLYDWARMEKDGFSWWTRRLRAAASCYDRIRLDHFRGLESYWSVPWGATSARFGRWVKGPGAALIDAIRAALPEVRFIAEDLGFLTPEVRELLRHSGFPGMKVLEFAFDSREPGNYLPDTYTENSACYTGTHDNETLAGWLRLATPEVLETARTYLKVTPQDDLRRAILRCGALCASDLFMAQMQDYLGLDARMNRPGTTDAENWVWRLRRGELTDAVAQEMRELAVLGNRI